MTVLNGTITEGIGTAAVQSTTCNWAMSLNDTFRLPATLDVIRARAASITDGIGVSETLVRALGVLVVELIKVRQQHIPNHHAQLSIIEQIVTTELIARGLPVSVSDDLGVELVQAAAQAVQIIEKLGLAPVVSGAAKYHLSVSETVRYADLLARFIGGSISESLGVAETLTGVALKPQSVTEGVGVADALTQMIVFRAEIPEAMQVTDAEVVRMIFSGSIDEAIEIAAAYFGPNGGVTTWAMNTRTAAVTEYTNYAFNSFARMGNKYLGATKDGLYELAGDTDAGTSIIADLKSGFAQFDGVHLASFKGAYIATRGGGSYVLRVFTGDGNRYDYSVTTDNMKTARIDMGKGIRARYFAFELISSGQDFDLESLEFVPLVAKRRV